MRHHIVYKSGGRVKNTGVFKSFYNAQDRASKLPINCDVVPVQFLSYQDYKNHMIKGV